MPVTRLLAEERRHLVFGRNRDEPVVAAKAPAPRIPFHAAAYLTWHLRRTLAPLTYTDEHPPTRENPVAPAQRSVAAARKASRHTDDQDQPVRSFRTLLGHLATLTRNDLRYGPDNGPIVPTLAEPTPTQRRVFELLDTAIPLTLN